MEDFGLLFSFLSWLTAHISVGAFVICWTPGLITLLLDGLLGKDSHANNYEKFCLVMAECNSLVNPIIYSLRDKEMRRTFKWILCCICQRSADQQRELSLVEIASPLPELQSVRHKLWNVNVTPSKHLKRFIPFISNKKRSIFWCYIYLQLSLLQGFSFSYSLCVICRFSLTTTMHMLISTLTCQVPGVRRNQPGNFPPPRV